MKLFHYYNDEVFEEGSLTYYTGKRDEGFGYYSDSYNEHTIKHFQDDNFYDGIDDEEDLKYF